MKTDFLGRRDSSSGKAERGATEGASTSRARQGQRRSRQTSETFATEPNNEPYSFQVLGTLLAIAGILIVMFQSFVMGADALAELESPLAEVDPGLQRTGRQFSFNDLNFEGFQGGASSQQSPFQSFPQFTSPASTSTTFARARQPIPSRYQPFNINQTQEMNKDKFSECKLLSHLFKALPYHVVVESARRQTRTPGFPLKRSNRKPALLCYVFHISQAGLSCKQKQTSTNIKINRTSQPSRAIN